MVGTIRVAFQKDAHCQVENGLESKQSGVRRSSQPCERRLRATEVRAENGSRRPAKKWMDSQAVDELSHEGL